MMKRHLITLCLTALAAALPALLASCSDDWGGDRQGVTVDDSNLVETRLTFDVAAMSTTGYQTRAVGDNDEADTDDRLAEITDEEKRGTEAERKIDNIWVFQFDASTKKLLITPRYYNLTEADVAPTETEGKEVDVLLKPDVPSIVYVVANTGSASWATIYNSANLDTLKKRTLPDPNYIAVDIGDTPTDLSLPMEGGTETVTPTKGEPISVTVTRMYAKVEIYIGDIPETIELTDVNVSQIPYYCRVGTLAPADPTQAATYPITHTDWNSRAFDPGTKDSEGKYTGKMTLYIPENLQGRTENTEADAARKSEDVPNDNALRVDFVANYVDRFTGEELERGRHYAVYPGANNYNDYNIKRNFIYRVKLNIYTDQYDQDIESSNCFVVKPGQLLSFLPYYRTEEGGGYDFADYLNPDGDDTKKINDSDTMAENVKIIWQTKDAIGDNTDGDRVWIDRRDEAENEFHRKIHVRTNQRGNALIAAYNSSGDIIWSWHIWVTENEPANVSSAIVYSTYSWNERQIFTDVRVPGYAIMPCNLGALKYYPDSEDELDPDTHGMLYQWGRKDPFPPSTNKKANDVDYNDTYTGSHYANDNTTVVGKTAGTDASLLFHSLAASDNNFGSNAATLKFTIQNPTVFMCGTKKASQSNTTGESYLNNQSNYLYGGDWLPDHDAKLWGGLEPDVSGDMKMYNIRNTTEAHIFDNYGDKKSIFDPCPSGWRVPPGDLWLGFTEDGMNPRNYSEINTATPYKDGGGSGLYMYMTDWRQGITSFFPTQGTRVPDGTILRTGSCGNYHNATTDINERVNILHIHRSNTLFNVFELTYYFYHVKTTGGPIRCVRDHK